jgi:hypothetical protein
MRETLQSRYMKLRNMGYSKLRNEGWIDREGPFWYGGRQLRRRQSDRCEPVGGRAGTGQLPRLHPGAHRCLLSTPLWRPPSSPPRWNRSHGITPAASGQVAAHHNLAASGQGLAHHFPAAYHPQLSVALRCRRVAASCCLIVLRQKTPPFRAGDEWRSGSPCGRLCAVPQGLRECTLVERGRCPSPHCSCQPVTAFHLRVSMSGPL